MRQSVKLKMIAEANDRVCIAIALVARLSQTTNRKAAQALVQAIRLSECPIGPVVIDRAVGIAKNLT